MRAEGHNLAIREQHAGGGRTSACGRGWMEHMHAGGGGACMRAEVEHACGRRVANQRNHLIRHDLKYPGRWNICMRAEVEHACGRRWNMHAGGGRTCMRAEGHNLAVREQHTGGGPNERRGISRVTQDPALPKKASCVQLQDNVDPVEQAELRRLGY